MVDHTAEIATLRQKLATAEARTQGVGRHNAAEADKDKIKLLPSRKSENAKSNPTLDETKSTPTLDDLSERMAALLRDLNAVRPRPNGIQHPMGLFDEAALLDPLYSGAGQPWVGAGGGMGMMVLPLRMSAAGRRRHPGAEQVVGF